jgi:hypothetical protein
MVERRSNPFPLPNVINLFCIVSYVPQSEVYDGFLFLSSHSTESPLVTHQLTTQEGLYKAYCMEDTNVCVCLCVQSNPIQNIACTNETRYLLHSPCFLLLYVASYH